VTTSIDTNLSWYNTIVNAMPPKKIKWMMNKKFPGQISEQLSRSIASSFLEKKKKKR
jgi:hypothetical protein